MSRDLCLSESQAASAAAIQEAIDSLGPEGGRVVLPAMELELDRGIQLRSHVALVGQGENTILRKAQGRVYPLPGYHNYGMWDVPLEYTVGLEPGMTVAIRDDAHGGFFETFARITRIDGNWVGLDRGVESDYIASQNPVLVTSFPLVYGEFAEDLSVSGLTLDGNRAEEAGAIGSCRGAAVYFYRCHGFHVADVEERDFAGEGLGFQICSHGTIESCLFSGNGGNGFHPGAGSTGVVFRECTAKDNGRAGFFFCVRANHITVEDCTFEGNTACGISVGTRDCHNLMSRCRVVDNKGPGILFRNQPRPVEVHSCVIEGCQISGNAALSGRGQIDIRGDAHDLIFEGNEIEGRCAAEKPGIYAAASVERLWLDGNDMATCWPDVVAQPGAIAVDRPEFGCGLDAAEDEHYRHLGQ